ncbi:MAG TPA: hypothetical protein PL131_05575 [Methylotenera sp.]|nr:hypothetical protein [Methylotenera sp.]HPH05325.1 hypothetical protein [Methylotenera sp.]HPN01635.1 hypothetical protein [Methylotenera sp.]
MHKKRVLYGVFWFFNILLGVFILYMAVAVQLGINVDNVGAKTISGAFQDGYMQGLALQKKEAIHFLKEYALYVALISLIISVIGTRFGWLPGTKPNKHAEDAAVKAAD